MGKFIDLTGEKIGKLTVIEKTNKRNNGKIVWLCKCECGNLIEVRSTSLTQKITTSCGCNRKLLNSKNLLGQKFGKLTVIEKTEKRSSGGNIIWKCKCDCGNIVEVPSNHLKNNETLSCGCLKSKGEMIISKILRDNNINFKKEYSFTNLKDKRALRFDFAIFDEKDNLLCLIEYDGIQHFDKNNKFYNDDIKLHDRMKNDFCEKNNVKLFRINYKQNINTEINEIKKYLTNIKK